MNLSFTIHGTPVTKKNSGQIVMVGKFPKIFPSKAFRAWNKEAQLQLAMARPKFALACPVNVEALFYREKSIGDAVGFYQALADALEEAHVVENDRWIVSWDGSRMLKDARNPRIEVTITPLAGEQVRIDL